MSPVPPTSRDGDPKAVTRIDSGGCVEPGCEAKPAGDPNFPGMCPVHAWREWFKRVDPEGFWNKVECIECALDRDCSKHPGRAE